ncbi:NAD-dependent epimerase/dehydratase family protein [Stakelama marina]|uniref:NAD-dependent epimerase/dehydratase n=1 Tax=Stakelama marina TaxID=2826939 RepID=A0A8T4IIH2_9SPHN|nr:NAD-dependent epimerase/dehydratase [Stakelama marina]MBR0552109.1 NAD-dependent epimerase/dehydratase [Stakelama marina]
MASLGREIGRIAVTGASGFIGRRLVRHLESNGCTVSPWSRPQTDLLDARSVARAIERDQPDTIFHLAATGVSASQAHDATVIGCDVAMVANLIAAAPSGTRILLAGSMSEYGRAGRLIETDRCMPSTAYGIAKLASGRYALAYGPKYGLDIAVLRLFGVYGPGEAPNRLFTALIEALDAGRPVDLSDGTQRRDFVHVDDVCATMMHLAGIVDLGSDPVINIGTGQSVCIRDVATWIADSVGAPHDLLRFGARPRSPGDEALLEANVARLTRLAGSVPPQRLSRGLSSNLLREGADSYLPLPNRSGSFSRNQATVSATPSSKDT